ncbi:MAG: IPT/TIG domain-containing protein [Candidatus Marinimicrobia bacterium]|nr:IPT/TIG domain-containing protein [Candidatus Neomarinimicrobiota bacterium]
MKTQNYFSCLLIGLILIGGIGCEYDDYPDPIWDPDDAGGPTPVITAMDPPDVAYDGLTVVTISGENFSPTFSENQITFNGVSASISAELSTEAELVVTMPIIISDASLNAIDGVQVMVAVQGSYAGAVYDQDFRVERAVIEWGSFIGEKPEKLPNAVAVDADENVFVAAGDKIIYKIDTLGTRTEFGTGLSTTTNDMKVGPGGAVYFARNNPFIYRVDVAGGAADRWHRVGSKIACFDFNADQNIYCGGKNDSLYFVDVAAETNRGIALAEDYSYSALRVYDGYVYIAGTYEGTDGAVTVIQGIWRHEILADDELGSRELVYDWAGAEYSANQDIISMVVDADGLFYLGLSEGSGPAIITVDFATQAVETFYDAVLTAPATSLAWGNSNFIYCVRTMVASTDGLPTGSFRIAQSLTGALYYGRN